MLWAYLSGFEANWNDYRSYNHKDQCDKPRNRYEETLCAVNAFAVLKVNSAMKAIKGWTRHPKMLFPVKGEPSCLLPADNDDCSCHITKDIAMQKT
jgi:hypothetical protein